MAEMDTKSNVVFFSFLKRSIDIFLENTVISKTRDFRLISHEMLQVKVLVCYYLVYRERIIVCF